MHPTVLVASPNNKSRIDRAELFTQKGYDVLRGANGFEVAALIKDCSPRLILVSEDMPSAEGVELVPMMRRLTMAPVIVMGDGGSSSLIKSVLNGADAYLSNSVDDDELLIRARNLLKRAMLHESPSSTKTNADAFDSRISEVGSPLTETETKLFKCLVERRNRLISGEELMSQVWGKPVNGGRLRFYIHSLRQKLGKHSPFKLHTQKGVGYRLIEAEEEAMEDAQV